MRHCSAELLEARKVCYISLVVNTNLCLFFSAPLNLPDIAESGIHIQRGLSSDTIAAQLAALQAPPPPPVSTVNQPPPSVSTTPTILAPGTGQCPAGSMVPAQFTGYPSVPTVYGQPQPGGYYNNFPHLTQPGALPYNPPRSDGAAGNNS